MTNDNMALVASAPRLGDKDQAPPAERSGPAIISLLQQSADVARRNEERAKAMAQRLSEELKALEQRNQMLEARVRDLNERAARAEQWLLHIYDEIHAQLVEQSPPISVDRGPDYR